MQGDLQTKKNAKNGGVLKRAVHSMTCQEADHHPKRKNPLSLQPPSNKIYFNNYTERFIYNHVYTAIILHDQTCTI